MGKNPAFQFYPSDWSNDTSMLPLEVKGAWIDIICSMWWNGNKGELTGKYEDFAILLRVSKRKAEKIINCLMHKQICDCLTDTNGNITLISRRMKREEKARKDNAERQQRHYYKKKEQIITKTLQETNKPSSTSSSYSNNNICAKFDEFYSEYPKKRGKKDALKAFLKLRPDDELHLTIIQNVKAWKQTEDWQKDKGQFIPLPATFIRGERWKDELPKEKKGIDFNKYFKK